jgi:protein gp37
MADKSKIEWTDASWPVVTGCDHISSGCDNCYAAKLTGGRLKHLPAYEGLAEKGRFNGKVRLLPDRLNWPLKWRKPRKIFVSDMADLFHKDVPDEYIAQVFAVMAVAKQHTFQVLTKRHARMRALLSNYGWWTSVVALAQDYGRPGPTQTQPGGKCALLNVWLGVSVENQQWADIRIPALLETPAAVRFLSCEPLLGPVDLWGPLVPPGHRPRLTYWLDGRPGWGPEETSETGLVTQPLATGPRIDWVIVGGESGPGSRPLDVWWLRSLVQQCRDGGVPVFVKQFGSEWAKDALWGGRSVSALGDPKGGHMGYWPADLRIREFPTDLLEVANHG